MGGGRPFHPLPQFPITPFASTMKRRVESELLDELPADDSGAVHSRRDLRLVNVLMGNVRALASAAHSLFQERPPGGLVDLGAGDGTLMLRVARRLSRQWRNVKVELVDRQGIVSAETCRRFEALSWQAEPVELDVFDWLSRPSSRRIDLITANLFLHHFPNPTLARLMQLAAEQTNCFLACEPRRCAAGLAASRALGLLGCNRVTRHDAVNSVRAGFRGRELSALWPRKRDWRLQEQAVGLFGHCFVAQRLPQRSDASDGWAL